MLPLIFIFLAGCGLEPEVEPDSIWPIYEMEKIYQLGTFIVPDATNPQFSLALVIECPKDDSLLNAEIHQEIDAIQDVVWSYLKTLSLEQIDSMKEKKEAKKVLAAMINETLSNGRITAVYMTKFDILSKASALYGSK